MVHLPTHRSGSPEHFRGVASSLGTSATERPLEIKCSLRSRELLVVTGVLIPLPSPVALNRTHRGVPPRQPRLPGYGSRLQRWHDDARSRFGREDQVVDQS